MLYFSIKYSLFSIFFNLKKSLMCEKAVLLNTLKKFFVKNSKASKAEVTNRLVAKIQR